MRIKHKPPIVYIVLLIKEDDQPLCYGLCDVYDLFFIIGFTLMEKPENSEERDSHVAHSLLHVIDKVRVVLFNVVLMF